MDWHDFASLGGVVVTAGGLLRVWTQATAGIRREEQLQARVVALEKDATRLESRDGRIFDKLDEIEKAVHKMALDFARHLKMEDTT